MHSCGVRGHSSPHAPTRAIHRRAWRLRLGIPAAAIGLPVLGGTILAHAGRGTASVHGSAAAVASRSSADVLAVRPTLVLVPNPRFGALAGPTTPTAVPVSPTGSTLATPTPWPPANPPAHALPTRIVAPSIDLDQKVMPVGWYQEEQGGMAVSVWDVAQSAVGRHMNSSLPGAGGNIVLAGHNSIFGEVFRYLENLKPGDRITVYADGRPYIYDVTEKLTVLEQGVSEQQQRENARWIGPFPDERLTLVACWPYTSSSHRLIIVAKPESQSLSTLASRPR